MYEKRAYLNLPEDELRETYANFEHLLSIEKTSKDELIKNKEVKIPPETLKEIEDLKASNRVSNKRIDELEKDYSHLEDVFNKTVDKLLKEMNELNQRISASEDTNEDYRNLVNLRNRTREDEEESNRATKEVLEQKKRMKDEDEEYNTKNTLFDSPGQEAETAKNPRNS